MTKLALVTGGAGFVGSHLVDALVAEGTNVRVLDNLLLQAHPTGKARFLSPGAELLIGDLRDRPTVDRALAGAELVFHLGGLVGNGQSMYDVQRYVDHNSVGTAVLIEAMLARRVQFSRLVVASSMVVYGDGAYDCIEHGRAHRVRRPIERLSQSIWEPLCSRCDRTVTPTATSEEHPLAPTSTYAISKRDQEELALVLGRTHDLPTVALRFLNVYGSRQALGNPYTGVAAVIANRILHGKAPIIFEDGAQRRDFTHVSDVVAANLLAARAPAEAHYEAFNVGTGRSVTILDLAQRIATGLGRTQKVVPSGGFRAGDIRHCFADVKKAQRLLGFTAKTTLEQGMSELLGWATGERTEDKSDEATAELAQRKLIRWVGEQR